MRNPCTALPWWLVLRIEQLEFFIHLIEAVEHWLLDFSTAVYELMGWGGVVVLMALESTAFPLPSEIVMPFAGWRLILDKGLGVEWVFVAGLWGAIGSVIGSLVEYYISRAGGRPLIERYGKYLLITRSDLERADHWFSTRGEVTILVGRLVPVVRHFISIPAGIAKMNVVKFSVYTFIGALPWCVFLAWTGYLLGDNYDAVRDYTRSFTLPIVVIGCVLVVWFLVHRIREIRAEAGEAVVERE